MKEAKRATNEWALENAADVSFANIEDFAKQNKLIQAIAFYLASKGEGEDHMARAIFDMADKENRGSVSYSELVEGRSRCLILSIQAGWEVWERSWGCHC